MSALEKDEGPISPPTFTGNAIEIRFPDYQEAPNKKPQKFFVKTFPDYVHTVYVEDKMYSVLGKDLEIGMAFMINGGYIPIIDIDKQVLYHGIMKQNLQLGMPCNVHEVERLKFIRRFRKDETQYWEIEKIEQPEAKI